MMMTINDLCEPGEYAITFRTDGTFDTIDKEIDPSWSYSEGILTLRDQGKSTSLKLLSPTSTSFIVEEHEKYPEGGEFYMKTYYVKIK